jgi:RND family efflux transporter MFP subunit
MHRLSLSIAALLLAGFAIRAQAEDAAPVGAQIVARTIAQIGAPMSGQLIEFPLSDGETFQAGQLLARFNCAQQEAAQGRARAELEKRRDIMATQQSLKRLNAYSQSDYKTAANDVAVAQAELAVAATAVANCVIKAPFSGRVASITVHNHQFVQMGATLLDILDDRDLEVELVAPSRWMAWMAPGAKLHVDIVETQRGYDAHLTRMSGRVDAASQTIKVYARIDGAAANLLPGMSGSASFPDAPK